MIDLTTDYEAMREHFRGELMMLAVRYEQELGQRAKFDTTDFACWLLVHHNYELGRRSGYSQGIDEARQAVALTIPDPVEVEEPPDWQTTIRIAPIEVDQDSIDTVRNEPLVGEEVN
jgi:hypothetical protein